MGAGQQRKEKIVDYDLRVISLGAGVQSTAITKRRFCIEV